MYWIRIMVISSRKWQQFEFWLVYSKFVGYGKTQTQNHDYCECKVCMVQIGSPPKVDSSMHSGRVYSSTETSARMEARHDPVSRFIDQRTVASDSRHNSTHSWNSRRWWKALATTATINNRKQHKKLKAAPKSPFPSDNISSKFDASSSSSCYV